MDLSLGEMQTFLRHGWCELGERVFETWADYNTRYFDGGLRPIAIVPTPTLPYGRCIGLTHGTERIMLSAPLNGTHLVADRSTLLGIDLGSL
jgi:hypothetical protein